MATCLSALVLFPLLVIGIDLINMAGSFRPIDTVLQHKELTLATKFEKPTRIVQEISSQKTVYLASSFLSYRLYESSTGASPVESLASDATGGKSQESVQPPKLNRHLNKGVLLTIIIVPCCLGSIMVISFLSWIYRQNSTADQVTTASPSRHYLETQSADRILSLGPWLKRLNSLSIVRKKGGACTLDYALLRAATNNFSSDNILGKGGFGCVYKARLNDDFFAAVKKFDQDIDFLEQDFQTEVELMSKIRHANLVSLLGFSIDGAQRLLVYELMQNGSLEYQLHGPLRGSALSWHMRVKIALDAARGLEYLHERCNPPVIHRDFKSSNILLDASFNAKLSDFGLAIPNPGSRKNEEFELQGTFGYVAPEYMLDGILSEKSDVYAFGVVLLELITGRQPIDRTMPTGCESLVTWASPQLTDRKKIPQIVDPFLVGSINLKHLYQVTAVAALCVQSEPSYRPLIADVVHSLIPLVPVELGGALRTVESGVGVEKVAPVSVSQSEIKSLSLYQNSSIMMDSREHL